jgi:hypothetical protein
MSFTFDYDNLIHLDAEALAETGIQEAYEFGILCHTQPHS